MQKRLRTAPFRIDADAIARGMLDDIFTETDRNALRFGMLPADKMEVVEKCLREKFLEKATTIDAESEKFLNKVMVRDSDQFTMIVETPDGREIVDFSMRKLITEAMHEISLALYTIGDLVV